MVNEINSDCMALLRQRETALASFNLYVRLGGSIWSLFCAWIFIPDQILFIDADGLFTLSFFSGPVNACPTDG